MSNFSKAKKYYTKSEVETQMRTLLGEAEIKISEQNSIIVGYAATVEKQDKEIKELKKREKIIRGALFNATEQSKMAFEEAQKKRAAEIDRLEKLKIEFGKKISQSDKKTAEEFDEQISELVHDLRSGIGAGELARRRELEAARKKLDEANKKNTDAQKSIDERYRAVLERYQALQAKSVDGEFSIEEALNPTASLEDIMKEIFKK